MFSEDLKNLLKMCLEKNPEKRVCVNEVLENPFFKKFERKKKIEAFFFERVFQVFFLRNIERGILRFFLDNFLNADEFLKLGEFFKEIDFDHKGFLEILDFEKIFGIYEKTILISKIEEIFRNVCREENKMVFSEFVFCCYNKENLFVKKNIFTAFQIFDFNKTGKIGFEDFNGIFEEINVDIDQWNLFILNKKFKEDGFIDFKDFEFLIKKI